MPVISANYEQVIEINVVSRETHNRMLSIFVSGLRPIYPAERKPSFLACVESHGFLFLMGKL